MDDADRVLLKLTPSPARRVVAAAVLAMTGGLLLYLAINAPQAVLLWQVFLAAIGALMLWSAVRLWRATADGLELSRTALRSTDGTVLCRIDDISGVERGTFAFKPSNGFVLRLDEASAGWAWAPGLWWRLGRRIGVGGVTPGPQGKIMAELIAELSEGHEITE